MTSFVHSNSKDAEIMMHNENMACHLITVNTRQTLTAAASVPTSCRISYKIALM